MGKEVLIYGYIEAESAGQFINTLEENKSSEIIVRLNTDGGSPEDGWGMIAKMAEHKGQKKFKVDGRANSTGFFLLCYADDSECLDVSTFGLHRAAYPQWIECDPAWMTQSLWDNLNKVNASLRKAVEGKIDVKKFERITGVTLDEIFSNASRKEVTLTADQALEIGLVNRIKVITPEKSAEINMRMQSIAAHSGMFKIAAKSEPIIQNTNIMTIEKFKAEHPSIYAEVLALGASQERDNVGAWMTFVEIDAKAVAEGIKTGKPISQTAMAEFSKKQFSTATIGGIAANNAPALTPEEIALKEKTDKQKQIEAFNANVYKHLNIKPEKI